MKKMQSEQGLTKIESVSIKQVHTITDSQYFIEMTYSSSNGLIIRLLNFDGACNIEQCYYLTISNDTMNDKLKHTFENAQHLFGFMKLKNNLNVDSKKGIIYLKMYKVVGEKVIDQSIRLILIQQQITDDKFASYAIKISLKVFNQKLQNQKQKFEQQEQKQNKKINELISQQLAMRKNVEKKSEQVQKLRNCLTFMFVLFVLILAFSCYKIQNKESNLQFDYQRIRKELLDLVNPQIKLMKVSQLNFQKDILKKINELQLKTEAKHKQLTSQIKVGVEYLNQVKENYQKLNDQSNKLINLLKQHQNFKSQKIEDEKQACQKQLKEKLSKRFDQYDEKINELENKIKKISIFDLSSEYIQSFSIQGGQITNQAISGRWTQILLRENIPYHIPTSYKFKITQSVNNAITLGVADAMRIKQRSSLTHNNTIAVSGRGEVWKNGLKQEQVASAFTSGSYVTMEVDLSKGVIRWIVDGEQKYLISSERLKDNTINFRPYIEMAYSKDVVEYIGKQ